jgi:hypothetical protein
MGAEIMVAHSDGGPFAHLRPALDLCFGIRDWPLYLHTVLTIMEADTPTAVPTKTKAPPTRKSQIIGGLLISAVTLFLCLGSIELAGFLWERSTAQGPLGWTLVASRRLDLALHGTSEHPYYLFEPNRSYVWEGIPVQINDRGFRTEAFSPTKEADVYRILNLGDSFVFGWEVNQEDTYGKLLEGKLNARGDGQAYEVINAGIPAWNLESERNFLLEEGLGYEPDLIILDVTVVNDIYGRGPSVDEGQSLFQGLRDHTYAWPFLTTQARFLLARQQGPEAMPVLNPPRRAESYYPLDKDDPTWDRIWGFIEEMYEASADRGADFIIVAFPTAFQLNSAVHPDVPQKVLGERAAAADITFVDLLPIYQQVCDEAAANDACEGYENLLFADVWMHPNQLGHRLTAETLESVIGRN